jgi:hypothetical protein
MNLSIVVQTCDKYEKFWEGFFYYMDKFWDKKIKVPIYFCTENTKINKKNIININTGKGTFVSNLNFILNEIKTDNIFYLLEDFWPIDTIKKDLFFELYDFFIKNNLSCLQISNYNPYYVLEKTEIKIQNQNILKFNKNSNWRFNFQARFWQKQKLIKSLFEPTISESKVSSAITVESMCDSIFPKDIDVFFYHRLWYPMSGVSYRGDFTQLGLELQNNMKVDLYGKLFSNN